MDRKNGGRRHGSSGKRPHSRHGGSEEDDDSSYKRRNPSSRGPRPSPPDPNSNPAAPNVPVEYRILCAAARIGGVIGKGGSIVKSLRLETRSKIKVEESVMGSDERVIYLASSRDGAPSPSDADADDADGYLGRYLCPAQDALFRIHQRIVEGDRILPHNYEGDHDHHHVGGGGNDEDNDDNNAPPQVVARLLVPGQQIGCILGKGGRIIEQLRRDIPCQIRVMPRNQLPTCAAEEDELLQISGSPSLVKKALYEISTRLYDNPPRERYRGGVQGSGYMPQGGHGMGSGAPMYSSGSYYLQGPMVGGGGNGWSFNQGYQSAPGSKPMHSDNAPEEEFVIRILCHNEKVGSIIGKGGSIIQKMREETGAKIRVDDRIPDCDERIFHISSMEVMTSTQSLAINAALQVQKRLADMFAEKDESSIVIIRLLLPSSQIGSLLGKGGSIITEMRRSTRASIRIPPRDELPRIAGESDEIIQISGELANAQAALLQVLNRLRANLFKEYNGVVSEVYPMIPGLGYAGSASIMPGYGMGYDMSMPAMTPRSSYGNYSFSDAPSSGSRRNDYRRRQKS